MTNVEKTMLQSINNFVNDFCKLEHTLGRFDRCDLSVD